MSLHIRNNWQKALSGGYLDKDEGSRWHRWAMVEAALTHVKYDTATTRAYQRIAERGRRKVALVATARRLLLSCYSVLKNRRPCLFLMVKRRGSP